MNTTTNNIDCEILPRKSNHRVINEEDMVVGNTFLCVYDSDKDEESTWHMSTLTINQVHGDLCSFEVHDEACAYHDEGTLSIPEASGQRSYNSGSGVDLYLCVVPMSCIAEEDRFLASLRGNYEHIVENLQEEGKIKWPH